MIVKKNWLQKVWIKYCNTQQYNLNRKNSGSILQSLYESILAARVNEKQNIRQITSSNTNLEKLTKRRLIQSIQKDGHSKPVFTVIYIADTKLIVSGSYDDKIKIQNYKTGGVLKLIGRKYFIY